jgi:phosphate-selective porin OprO/OprP
MKDLPVVGEVRVGHQKEPLSLEQLNNAMYTVFMERGISYAFVPGRNTGVKMHNSGFQNRVGWALGAFKDVDDTADGFEDASDYNFTARITALPWYENNGRQLLHLGLGYSHQFRNNDTVRYRERPETHITDVRLVDTGNINDVEGVNLINPEIGFVHGPFSLQGEYVMAAVDAKAAEDPDFDGFYVFASYFLTGENRQYRMDDGGGEFTRIKIKNNFVLNNPGWGAWEVALRYSTLDLNEEGINGGEEKNWSAALNWYLNPNLRWSFNYLHAKVEDRRADETLIRDAGADIWTSRFQVSF